MTKKRERDGRDDNVPVVVVEDATERHLFKARKLLREAQSRLSSHDDGAIDSKDDDDKDDAHAPPHRSPRRAVSRTASSLLAA